MTSPVLLLLSSWVEVPSTLLLNLSPPGLYVSPLSSEGDMCKVFLVWQDCPDRVTARVLVCATSLRAVVM